MWTSQGNWINLKLDALECLDYMGHGLQKSEQTQKSITLSSHLVVMQIFAAQICLLRLNLLGEKVKKRTHDFS